MSIENCPEPNRWLRIRQARGFTPQMFDIFAANVEIFVAHANALLSVWHRIHRDGGNPQYLFFPPEMSQDLVVASLPIGGLGTVSSRSSIENGCSYLLWQHFPSSFMEGLEEGITETYCHVDGPITNWRIPSNTISFMLADPEHRRQISAKL